MSANTLIKPSKVHRRFFYHYNKHLKKMSIHWKNSCTPVDELICLAPAETKTYETQPKYVLQGWTSNIEFVEVAGKLIATVHK